MPMILQFTPVPESGRTGVIQSRSSAGGGLTVERTAVSSVLRPAGSKTTLLPSLQLPPTAGFHLWVAECGPRVPAPTVAHVADGGPCPGGFLGRLFSVWLTRPSSCRTAFLRSRPRWILPVQSLVCLAAFGLALPLAISLFPQMSEVSGCPFPPQPSPALLPQQGCAESGKLACCGMVGGLAQCPACPVVQEGWWAACSPWHSCPRRRPEAYAGEQVVSCLEGGLPGTSVSFLTLPK